jgi:hypothetical protein
MLIRTNLTGADLNGAKMPSSFSKDQKIKVQKVGETELSGPDM